MSQPAPYPGDKIAYTIPETMQILRVSRPTLYRAISEGKLRSKKIGGRRLVTRKDLLNFLGEDE